MGCAEDLVEQAVAAALCMTEDGHEQLQSVFANQPPSPTAQRAATAALCALLAEPWAYDYTRLLLTSEAARAASDLRRLAGLPVPQTRWPLDGLACCSVRQARELYEPALAGRVKFLLDSSADPNGLAASAGAWCGPPQSPLMCCAIHGWEVVAQTLLRAQAAPSQTDLSNATALHYAATHGEETMYNLLLGAAADPNQKDAYGRSATELLATTGVALHFCRARGLGHPAGPQESGMPIRLPGASLSVKRFVEDFVALKRPALLRREHRGTVGDDDGNGKSLPWSREDLADAAGEARAMVSEIPYGADFGLDPSQETPTTLRDFLQATPQPPAKRQRCREQQADRAYRPYFFVAVDKELQPQLARLLEAKLGVAVGGRVSWPFGEVQPAQSLPFTATTIQFAVGGEGSGSPMHFHQDALNLCLRGRKRWWLVPPSEAAFSRLHPLDALDMGTSANSARDCLEGACVFEQEEGDVVYVPDMWGHAVLNLEDHTACVAAEFA
ncbi:JMJD8 [Symbiodinium natans]|uniref:JMJD8 protein n=1 Tax=Symbiodinium natans TaxID=878477 RepID=A0A812KZU7_9DINO|nr:JMJD8 [Symbiodinium natans]